MIEMALKGSGIRDTSRVLKISTDTVLQELKKKEANLESVNHNLLKQIAPENLNVRIMKVEEAELDEMWSYGGHKSIKNSVQMFLPIFFFPKIKISLTSQIRQSPDCTTPSKVSSLRTI